MLKHELKDLNFQRCAAR